jgi:L-gulonolactone oxidase
MAEQQEPGPYRWRNWSGEQRCRPTAMARPNTREGLIAAVIEASNEGRRVKVAGAGHSFTPAALTDGTMLRIESLDRILAVDRAAGTVKVEAGITLHELGRRLDRLGLAMENLGDIDRQTLAGAISTATHGTGQRYPNISAQVAALEVVTADGTTVELSEESDPDGFRAARVGLGALGAIYSVTLRVVPPFRIERVDRRRPLAETLERLDELAAANDHFEFYVFPRTEWANCRESTRTDRPADPPGELSSYVQEVVFENWVGSALAVVARRVPATVPTLTRIASAGAGMPRKLDHSYRVFASERRIKFTEMEYGVPREHARAAIEDVLAIANRPELALAFPIEVRFVAADDALLSPSHERDTAYIAVHHDRKSDWETYFRAVAEAMAKYGGRPHWGKRHFLGAEELRELYPRFDDFLAVRDRLDPQGMFANDYTDRVLGPVAVPVPGRRRRRR